MCQRIASQPIGTHRAQLADAFFFGVRVHLVANVVLVRQRRPQQTNKGKLLLILFKQQNRFKPNNCFSILKIGKKGARF